VNEVTDGLGGQSVLDHTRKAREIDGRSHGQHESSIGQDQLLAVRPSIDRHPAVFEVDLTDFVDVNTDSWHDLS